MIDRSAIRCVLKLNETVGYTLLVEISICRKREQTCLLVLPAEAATALLARSLEHIHLDKLTPHTERLAVGNGKKRVAVNALDISVAERV